MLILHLDLQLPSLLYLNHLLRLILQDLLQALSFVHLVIVLLLLQDELALPPLQLLLLLLLLVLEPMLDHGAQAALAEAPWQMEVAAVAQASLAARRRGVSADWKETVLKLGAERGFIEATQGTLAWPFAEWLCHTVADLNALRCCAQLHGLVLEYGPDIRLLAVSFGLTRLCSLLST